MTTEKVKNWATYIDIADFPRFFSAPEAHNVSNRRWSERQRAEPAEGILPSQPWKG